MFLAFALAAAAEPAIPTFDVKDFEAIKLQVGVTLKDDRSARWKLQQPVDRTSYCGWVNSKNSYGAYSGWQPFAFAYFKPEGLPVKIVYGPFFLDTEPAVGTNMFFAACESAGFSLSTPPAVPDN